MEQWGFYFDQTRCTGCKTCVIACKSWNEDKRGDAQLNPDLCWVENQKYDEPKDYENPPGSDGGLNFKEFSKYHMKENWRKVTTQEYGTVLPNVDVLHLSISCHHCSEPACTAVCPTHFVYKDNDKGLVLTDSQKPCMLCRACQRSCPWKSPQFYDDYIDVGESSERVRMTKCTLCNERIDAGLKPACVAACPMRALDAGPIEQLKEKYQQLRESVENFKVDEKSMSYKPTIIFKKKEIKIR